MSRIYNIYCDESCHLENDGHKIMVLGAVWCPEGLLTRRIAEQVRQLKLAHRLSPAMEVKWTKVSPGKQSFYTELLDLFFGEPNLHFRALIVADKSKLRHGDFGQDHDTWYYKMYFNLLKMLLSPKDRYRIYLDIKDSLGGMKLRKLHAVLCNNAYDFDKRIIERVQLVRSHEVEQVQLADLLSGTFARTSCCPGRSWRASASH